MFKKRFYRLNNKKGFAIQFNWLFVLIGGIIILGFFFSLITNQASQAEKKSEQESTQELDDVLKVSAAATDTQRVFSLGRTDKKITFSCGEISEYFIGGSFKPGRYDYNAIFSPVELKSKELIVQTSSFDAPFKIMPVVYATAKDVEYVFVGSSTALTLLYNAMPDNATKKNALSGTVPSYKNNNYDHTVFLTTDEAELSTKLFSFTTKNDHSRVYAVVIKPSEGAVNYGELLFYKYDNTGFVLDGKVPYFDVEQNLRLILGGVISHDKTIYECNLRKILQRTALLTKLHEQRLLYFVDNSEDYCKPYYNTAKGYVETIQQYAEKTEWSVDDFKSMLLAINDLRTLNSHLITTECPRIY